MCFRVRISYCQQQSIALRPFTIINKNMESEADRCNVCGSTDSKLIDGFYYCTECGTQNTNVRETIIEDKALADGTFAHTTKKKIVHLKKDGIEMSGEWYRWHAYNFILSGLANELVALGAKPTFKIKLLWIWTRYIKKYQNKAELKLNKTSQDDNDKTGFFSLNVEDSRIDEEEQEPVKKRQMGSVTDNGQRDISFLSKGLIIAMLYVALNLDESDIQLSHVYRFVQEKHLDIRNVSRLIPEDINVKKIPQWIHFLRSKLCTVLQVRALVMSLFRKLDLGIPRVPDLRKIVDNFLIELCLPNDIKPLIYSLMHYGKCNFLDVDNKSKTTLLRIPDYEGTVMTYVLVAIKICFGLDGYYEYKLSDVVDKINHEKDLHKSYKMGKYSDPSDRLFSFREWCSYLQFRKVMLSKYCLRIAEKNRVDIDDYVYLEHIEERPKSKEQQSDKISMDIISRLPEERNLGVIPKSSFIPTLTPLSEYTEIIIEYSQDTEVKLKLAEDFKRYSLKYACENLELLDSHMENVIKGVNDDKKTESKVILGTIVMKKAKTKMVYVKNCENRNWLKTNPPTMDHVITVDDVDNETNDKESDHGYDSEITSKEKDIDSAVDRSVIEKTIIEERSKVSDSARNEGLESILKENNQDNMDKIFVNQCMPENVLVSESAKENHSKEIIENNRAENVLYDKQCFSSIDKTNNNQIENAIREQGVENNKDERFSDHSSVDDNIKNNIISEEGRQNGIQENNQSVLMSKEKYIANIASSNTRNEHKKEIIQEESIDNNIFDDCFEDLTFKEECEQNDIDNRQIDSDDNEDNQIQHENVPDEDFDRRSDISDIFLPTFNPDTFDRDRTIRELILHACKKYKISAPAEYKVKDPRKRKETNFLGDIPTKRPKRAKYEGKATVKQLLTNYYDFIQSDFVTKVGQELSLAVRNAELENQTLQQNTDLSNTNLQISVQERNSIPENGLNTTITRSVTDNTIMTNNEILNITNNTELNDKTVEIDINLENTLFDDDEMLLDDVIPKGDPKYDEEIYETDQLYIKIKEDHNEISIDGVDDPDIDKILSKKIEETCDFTKLKAKPKEHTVKKKIESDSEDDVPLSEFKNEKLLIEEMYHQEDDLEQLIKKEIPEYKYWIRHYDRDYINRIVDLHTTFDKELKENTPTSFFFVLQECASILNCSNFYLYKSMQGLEEYLVSKTKQGKSNEFEPFDDNIE